MENNKRPLYIPYAGPALLETPLLNKGTAFTMKERSDFNLTGLVPQAIETIEEQTQRALEQCRSFRSDINKHIFLRNIQDTNETLFYRLITENIVEMMPIIYTPTVGLACEQFSNIYRRSRGLFIAYPDKDNIEQVLNNATRHHVKVIVVTDGERILGLGDQGIGGMGIPIGKLSLYTACGGISPAYTQPVVLDVGTNNQQLLDDPMYMGWRHERIEGSDYDEFVEEFMQAVHVRWPEALIQFEDFAQANANPLLKRYRHRYCCFNDDIQGTASVTVGSLMAACRAKNQPLSDQRVCFVGAGSAGCGIAEAIVKAMCKEGLSDAEARKNIFMVDRQGLLLDDSDDLKSFQEPLCQSATLKEQWSVADMTLSLQDVVDHAQPTILIGVSGVAGMFNEELIRKICSYCEHPIIFPLSNPTSRVEATPENLIQWSNAKALIATGSPFPPVEFEGKTYPIAQCNNSYIFPGIGLAVIAAKITQISDEMLIKASETLAKHSPLARYGKGLLLPPLDAIQPLSKAIALEVSKQAIAEGFAPQVNDDYLEKSIQDNFWQTQYRNYRRTSF
ncbi:NAD-dependent malic enzyme [Celerinatantimonas diazotrophica]|uniref:malate dehydrogenase (oxaloacetate-decarboxylating) n=1 Tax=Celerinatantimonas diazotrophica TaxID=412034 RepID=A0A4R1J9Q8_9GAMM|nr:NAD-dependent malic enzyme [Celerinatantimonas diazotrophica]TCK47250.1 NAD-dependent malic enzyme [Celerinatantimonas diazotrophica]CAG9296022.1 NAD-dependent malic enzyme [Celerinatantimonas diazotrophica]